MRVDGLHFHYPDRRLFADWSAAIAPGVTLVRGGDGTGKSTLLRLLAGEMKAQAGRFTVHESSLTESPQTYRQQVFWTDMRSQAFEQQTALDYFETLRARYPRWEASAVARLSEGLALTPHLGKPLYMLSTGSKRKVWLVAAFACGAAITLIDDPFAALDKASIQFVLARLRQAAQHPARAWVLADYEAPAGVPLALTIELPD